MYVIPKLGPSLNTVFQMSVSFERKERCSFEEGSHERFRIKKGALSRVNKVFDK